MGSSLFYDPCTVYELFIAELFIYTSLLYNSNGGTSVRTRFYLRVEGYYFDR